MKTIKLGLILAAYAVASCFCLALINNITSPVIAKNKAGKVADILKVVFADADSFEQVSDFKTGEGAAVIDALYIAKKGKNVSGAVTQITGATYDKATILVGQDLKGTVTGVQFLELSDSPGFGQKARDPAFKVSSGKTFYEQFTGKKVKDGFVPGATFEAISGSSITSKGVAALLSQATITAGTYLSEKYGGEAVGN
ncbi:FMN-binding protein [Treponema parvum]|uniref:FMN-binding protein n=1 Tax=Treponema parvum TaxID=138851 RepID=A0A975F0W0_9SPIR|nr:FMN-binding protein [Treponema parvum]QTQ12307.1 FMN-binding protein [Treponema parvum]